MSLELFLDFALSFVVLYIYHSDCHSDRAVYACATETPLFAPVHREFAPTRHVSPEDYESTSYLVQPDDVWVADPMDTDEPDLAQLFAMADAIEPMEAEVAAELAELSAQVEAIVEEYEARGLSSSVVSPVSVETKATTVAQLKLLVESLGLKPARSKADLTEQALNAFADRGISTYEIAGVTFVPSADDTRMHVVK